jgi:rhodanese-related sulfurtransferase
MGPSASQMVAAAKARIENLSPDRVAAELEAGSVLIVDIREEYELAATGSIVPSIHAPRGLLEFYADPSSPTHLEEMDPGNRIILASATGARSALAAETLKDMGFRHVAHLDGGIRAWIDQGFPVAQPAKREHAEERF